MKKLFWCALLFASFSTHAMAENIPSWKGRVNYGPQFELSNPGYFDVGGGFALIKNVNGVNSTASGFMLSVKAYPWGRWYASKPKVTAAEVTQKTIEAAKAENNPDKVSVAAQALQNYLEKQTELFPVVGQSSWYNRISVFYGRSPGNFDVPTIKGSVDAIGIAYDIAPEFAVTVGFASYQATLANGNTQPQQTLMFGVQMNLNAFSSFRKLSD